MSYLKPVKGYNDLLRDENTGMIISINKHDAEHYKRVRATKIKQNQEIEDLKSDVSDIKAMLKKLLENQING